MYAQVQRFGAEIDIPGELSRRFAGKFEFPQLRWILLWLAAYTLILGALNFAVLRRLHRLEFGWVTMCALAVIFATGFYVSSAAQRPKNFHLDNMATYYLDSKSPLASADYDLLLSAPNRSEILVSVAGDAVFNMVASYGPEFNSQIWADMNRQATQAPHEYEIRLGQSTRVEVPMLKWSFHDLSLRGLREFPGTVHMVMPDRLRNDTGQRIEDAVFLDGASKVYMLPTLAAGQEVQLDAAASQPLHIPGQNPQPWDDSTFEHSKLTLQDLAVQAALRSTHRGPAFAGFSDGPALLVQLNVPHQESVHSLFVVSLEQP